MISFSEKLNLILLIFFLMATAFYLSVALGIDFVAELILSPIGLCILFLMVACEVTFTTMGV